MSRVKTLQDIETESEKVVFRKKEIEAEMGKVNTLMKELNNEIVEKGTENKATKIKLNMCIENYNKMKAERDTLKSLITELKSQLEKTKSEIKPVEKIKGYNTIMTREERERGIDELFKKKYSKDIEEFAKMFE